ncbi:MAG TPA: hypothetical protein VF736_05770 [Pyrinomonadaceae bacterium]|jgi:hypothetical protein
MKRIRRGAWALAAATALALGLWQQPEARAQWATSGSNNINTTNNVGIGTTSAPASKLEVVNTAGGYDAINYFQLSGTTSDNNNYPGLQLKGGTLATEYPRLMLGNGGLSAVLYGGRSSTYSNRIGLALNSNAGGSGHAAIQKFDGTTTTNLLYVADSGNVGVGTSSPDTRAHVVMSSADTNIESGTTTAHGLTLSNSDATPNNYASLMFSDGAGQGSFAGMFGIASDHTNNYGDLAFLTRGVGGYRERLRVTSAGNVGVGTAAPGARLQVSGAGGYAAAGAAEFRLQNTAWGGSFTQYLGDTGTWQLADASTGATKVAVRPGVNGEINFFSGAGNTVFNGTGNVGIGVTNPAARLDVAGAARVGGDLTVTGNVTGANLQATYQDVAEWVPSTQKLAAGTVVVLDAGRTNHVLASASEYDTKVAGVVSAEPGVILGVPGEGKVKVATTGRVKVRVDASSAPIKIGDLLVTSGVEGVAMKSEPVVIGGRQMHAPGTIIGKALEPLEKGTGEILVLLSLQ